MTLLKRFTSDQRGMETVEWVVMGALVILGIVAVAGPLITTLDKGMNAVTDEVQLAISSGQDATSE